MLGEEVVAIYVDAEVVLFGMFTKSKRPVTGNMLHDIRSKFYKLDASFIVDISSDSILWVCQSHPQYFKHCSELRDGYIMDVIKLLPQYEHQFKSGELFDLWIRTHSEEEQEKIRKAFGLEAKGKVGEIEEP